MDDVTNLFHQLAPKIINLARLSQPSNVVVAGKGHSSDFATKLDVDVENLIVEQIHSVFPDDRILAEEGYSSESIGTGRLWIIDPICGTANLGHGMVLYCSNIALAIDGELVASCVVDFTTSEYYWSVGGGEVWCGNKPYQLPGDVPGTLVDVDLGSSVRATQAEKMRQLEGLKYLQENTDYMLCSLNTSLNVLYVALHKIDGMYCMNTNPWDVAAGAFLMQQTGIIFSNDTNSSSSLRAHSYVAARSIDTANTLRQAFYA